MVSSSNKLEQNLKFRWRPDEVMLVGIRDGEVRVLHMEA